MWPDLHLFENATGAIVAKPRGSFRLYIYIVYST